MVQQGKPAASGRRAPRARRSGLVEVSRFEDLTGVLDACSPQVISADFFDTLVHRRCGAPESLFVEMARSSEGLALGLDAGWPERRMAAERALVRAAGRGETSLAQIHARLREQGDVAAPDLEARFEAGSWVANDDLIGLLRDRMAAGTPVVVSTDTYLPADLLRAWLDERLPGARLYCSSALGVTKRRGGLFRRLAADHPGQRIVHIGDNARTDGRAAEHGLVAVLLRLPGGLYARLPATTRRALRGLATPSLADADALGLGTTAPATLELALSWSLVLLALLQQVEETARRTGADQVWFLGRDGESLFDAVRSAAWSLPRATYVEVSRLALSVLDGFSGDGEPPAAARDCLAYLHARLAPGCERLLIVDIGWKGRLQDSLRRALPATVALTGCYFALQPAARLRLGEAAEVLLPWDRGVYNQAMTEALSGYVEPACVGYHTGADGEPAPLHGGHPLDRSDRAYTDALRLFLRELLALNPPSSAPRISPDTVRRLVRRLHMFPTRGEAAPFALWRIATRADGSDTRAPVAPPPHARWTTAAGFGSGWPGGQIAVSLGDGPLARALQGARALAASVRSAIQRRTART